MVRLIAGFFTIAAFTLTQCQNLYWTQSSRIAPIRQTTKFAQNQPSSQTKPPNQGTQPKPGDPGNPGTQPKPGNPGNPGTQPKPGNPGTQPKPGNPGNPGTQPKPDPGNQPNPKPKPGEQKPYGTHPVNPKPKPPTNPRPPTNPAKPYPGTKPTNPKPGNDESFSKCTKQDCKECSNFIQSGNPQLQVVIVPEGMRVTSDYRTDRVRIYCDNYHRVKGVPKIG